MGDIEAALAEHAFEHLFIECLGWDRVRAHVPLHVRDMPFTLQAVAQKRGFTVFSCHTHRTVLADRKLLREIQQRLRKTHHEHILISNCGTPRKQVWQWATLVAGQRRILHREHPFFSDQPPQRLLERIQGLAVSFQDEEQTRLTDVLDRVRTALLPDNELNLFTKHPRYAYESDRLALAMRNGEPRAFEQFVELHRPLVRHASRRLARWFEMDAEDAQQTAMIGLIIAAQRWEPERGCQFSTYAHHWLLHACEKYGQKWGTWFHVPQNWFFPCYRLRFTRTRLVAAYGEREAESRFDVELAAAGISREKWTTFCAARQVEFLSKVEAARRVCPDSTGAAAVMDAANSDELRDAVACALRSLSSRHGQIVRLRYGIGDREHTLQEVADKIGVSRERVRQIQTKAEEKLGWVFRADERLKERLEGRKRDAAREVDEE